MAHLRWLSSILNVMDQLWYFTPIPVVRKPTLQYFDWIIRFYCCVNFCLSSWQSTQPIFSNIIFLIVRAGLTDDLKLVQEKNAGILHWWNMKHYKLITDISKHRNQITNIAVFSEWNMMENLHPLDKSVTKEPKLVEIWACCAMQYVPQM